MVTYSPTRRAGASRSFPVCPLDSNPPVRPVVRWSDSAILTLAIDLRPIVNSALYTDPVTLRRAVRAGRFTGPTAGLAPGYLQGNLVILPDAYADAFESFCRANPRPCPLLARGVAGDPRLPSLADDLDIRSDVPGYRLFTDGRLSGEAPDIRALWRDDLVSFVLGCSFTFEHALIDAGIRLRHVQEGRNVAMYVTSMETVRAGPFAGPMVVSMRPIPQDRLADVIAITERFPHSHGAPVHTGDPREIGIDDLGRPDFGDAVTVRGDEIPVFWACGVTPQAALLQARLPFAVTHQPGHMLVTDVHESSL